MAYYVDTCIYVNLWQKETGRHGQPFWRYAAEFFRIIEEKEEILCFSGFVLKEIQFILSPEEFMKKRPAFDLPPFWKIPADDYAYSQARELESREQYIISFFDCMHIVLALRSSSVLITRDRKLLEIAKKYCDAATPEEIIWRLSREGL